MNATAQKLETLLTTGLNYLSQTPETEMMLKPAPEKWSKKEILGHLIDSGINNLQRFTEIQFESKPYKLRKYKQDELVLANDYQHAETKELAALWTAINKRISSIIQHQKEETLNFKIEIDGVEAFDLRFLMVDYVDHLEHHLDQILK